MNPEIQRLREKSKVLQEQYRGVELKICNLQTLGNDLKCKVLNIQRQIENLEQKEKKLTIDQNLRSKKAKFTASKTSPGTEEISNSSYFGNSK